MTAAVTARPKFGITQPDRSEMAAAAAETTAWRFSHQWEMLELADGSIFFDSVYANHRSIAAPARPVREALRRFDEQPMSMAQVAAQLPELGGEARLQKILAPLISAGILVEDLHEQVPDWAEPALVDRFATQLEWLTTLTSDPGGHWELFRRLRQSTVAVIGMGGAGSLIAHSLAAAGVGRLIIADGDLIEASNLVRQVLYDSTDCGDPKVARMASRIEQFTPFTEVETRQEYISSPADASAAIAGADFVALCADAPRFILNRWIDAACKSAQVPYIGALAGCVGPLYRPGHRGCFACLESQFRCELGERHDMVVDALAGKSSWRYPSFVAGPMSIAPIVTTDIVLTLTGAARPGTDGGMVRIQHPQATYEPLPLVRECDCAPQQ